jgi:small nuclear ribonucleoprotein (snRNP)-like protein
MVGKTVSVILRDGHDIEGKLMEASEQTLVLTVGKINAVVILANVIMILEGGLNIETEDMGVA